jgi:hypothetical protein
MSRLYPGIPSLQRIYTDDAITMAPDRILDVVTPLTSTHMRSLLGADSVNPTKTSKSTRTTVLGFLTDSVYQFSAPSYRALLKLFYVFFVAIPTDITTNTMLDIKTLQTLASLAIFYFYF